MKVTVLICWLKFSKEKQINLINFPFRSVIFLQERFEHPISNSKLSMQFAPTTPFSEAWSLFHRHSVAGLEAGKVRVR